MSAMESEEITKLWMENGPEDQTLKKLIIEGTIPKGLGPMNLESYFSQYKPTLWPEMKLKQFCGHYAWIMKGLRKAGTLGGGRGRGGGRLGGGGRGGSAPFAPLQMQAVNKVEQMSPLLSAPFAPFAGGGQKRSAEFALLETATPSKRPPHQHSVFEDLIVADFGDENDDDLDPDYEELMKGSSYPFLKNTFEYGDNLDQTGIVLLATPPAGTSDMHFEVVERGGKMYAVLTCTWPAPMIQIETVVEAGMEQKKILNSNNPAILALKKALKERRKANNLASGAAPVLKFVQRLPFLVRSFPGQYDVERIFITIKEPEEMEMEVVWIKLYGVEKELRVAEISKKVM